MAQTAPSLTAVLTLAGMQQPALVHPIDRSPGVFIGLGATQEVQFRDALVCGPFELDQRAKQQRSRDWPDAMDALRTRLGRSKAGAG